MSRRWAYPLLCLFVVVPLQASFAQDKVAVFAAAGQVKLLPSFGLGERAAPAARGALGELAKEAPEDPSHPLPRVTVDVVSAKGMKASAIQAAARRGFWAKAIKCYRQAAHLNQSLRIDQTFNVQIANGKAKVSRGRPKVVKKKAVKKPDQAPSTAPDPKQTVDACILDSFQTLALPNGKKTTATINVRIAAGDEPIASPSSPRERGSGTIDGPQLDRTVAQLGPSFEACYRASLDHAPKLWGTLAVRLKIEPDGRVSEAFEHGGPFPEGRVTRCVLATFRAARLLAPQGGAMRLIVPFELTP